MSKGTNQRYGLHSSASSSVHSTSVTVLGLLKKKKNHVQNGVFAVFAIFRLISYLTVVMNGFNGSGHVHALVCYRNFTRNTLIEAAKFISWSFLHTNLLAWLVILLVDS